MPLLIVTILSYKLVGSSGRKKANSKTIFNVLLLEIVACIIQLHVALQMGNDLRVFSLDFMRELGM